jgi:hypothetical protein
MSLQAAANGSSSCEGRGRLGGGEVVSDTLSGKCGLIRRNPSPTLPCLRRGGSQKQGVA